MKKLHFAAVLAFALAASPAVSAPADGARTIARSRVLLGDIADVPSDLASIDLGKSPRPGASRIVTLEEIQQAVAAGKQAKTALPALPKTIKVVRGARKVDKTELASIAEVALGGQNIQRGARVVSAVARANATVAEGYDATRVDLPRLPRKSGKLTTPATLRFLEGGEEVSSVLVEVVLDLPASAAIPDVKKGTKLALVVVRGSIEVRAAAVANEDADVGDVLGVTVADSKKSLRARLTAAAPATAMEAE